MAQNNNPNEKKPPTKQNPILLFVIFAIVAMLIVKFTSSDTDNVTRGISLLRRLIQ